MSGFASVCKDVLTVAPHNVPRTHLVVWAGWLGYWNAALIMITVWSQSLWKSRYKFLSSSVYHLLLFQWKVSIKNLSMRRCSCRFIWRLVPSGYIYISTPPTSNSCCFGNSSSSSFWAHFHFSGFFDSFVLGYECSGCIRWISRLILDNSQSLIWCSYFWNAQKGARKLLRNKGLSLIIF